MKSDTQIAQQLWRSTEMNQDWLQEKFFRSALPENLVHELIHAQLLSSSFASPGLDPMTHHRFLNDRVQTKTSTWVNANSLLKQWRDCKKKQEKNRCEQ